MAFAAFDILMHSEEWVIRTAVIKLIGRLELSEIMTF